MKVCGFEHFTVRTDILELTKEFYINLLGLKEGKRPSFSFRGYWLYLDDAPILHLFEIAKSQEDEVAKYVGMPDEITTGSGCVDHISFRIEGYDSLLARVKRHGWNFFERTVPDLCEHQCFFHDPNGIKIELIFHDSEYQAWQRQQTAICV